MKLPLLIIDHEAGSCDHSFAAITTAQFFADDIRSRLYPIGYRNQQRRMHPFLLQLHLTECVE